MPTSKRRLAHLKNVRLASVGHFKNEQAHRFSTEQSRIDDNELSTSDTGNTGDTDADTDADTKADTDEEGTRFWNKSANKLQSDLECSGDSEKEEDLALERSRTEQKTPLRKQPKEINGTKKGRKTMELYKKGFVYGLSP